MPRIPSCLRSFCPALLVEVLRRLRSTLLVVDGPRQLERARALRASLPELQRILPLDALTPHRPQEPSARYGEPCAPYGLGEGLGLTVRGCRLR